MDATNETSNSFMPHKERSEAGKNWEILKSTVLNPSSSDKSSSNNTTKKKRRRRRKPKIMQNIADNVEDDKVVDEKQKLTKQLAMDCEMVGIRKGRESMIARVSIVNRYGYCVYDKYVKPREPVYDYRTRVSGIRARDLRNAEDFDVVQKEVAQIIKGRIIIGHALKHDFDVLYLSHPIKLLRDTSNYKTFRQFAKGGTPSLKKLAHDLLGIDIQIGEHSSVEDARAAMQIYVLYKNKWESEFHRKR